MKQCFGVGQRAKPIVKQSQSDHHQHRRQNKTRQRDKGAAPAAQTKPNVSNRIAGARAGQALAQGQRFNEIMFVQPTPFLNHQMPDLSKDCEPAAESGEPDF
jgi:hypothetical protein